MHGAGEGEVNPLGNLYAQRLWRELGDNGGLTNDRGGNGDLTNDLGDIHTHWFWRGQGDDNSLAHNPRDLHCSNPDLWDADENFLGNDNDSSLGNDPGHDHCGNLGLNQPT